MTLSTPAQLNLAFPDTAPPGTIVPANLRAVVSSLTSSGPVSVTYFGAQCDGVTNDGAAFAAAAAANVPIYIPDGSTSLVDRALTFSNGVFSGPGSATIKWMSDLGAETIGLTCNGGNIANLNLRSSNVSFTLGQAPVLMHGLQIGVTPGTAPQPTLSNLNVQGFYGGIVLNSNFGHIRIENTIITNNFYGIYLKHLGSDLKCFGVENTGNSQACIAMAGGSDGLDTCTFVGCHIGFTPFGIYQEAASSASNGFLTSTSFYETHFESIGNAMMAARGTFNGVSGQPVIDAIKIQHPGFSWNASYQLTNTVATSGTATNGSAVLTSVTYTSGIQNGMIVTAAAGIPVSTFVIAVGSNAAHGISAGQVLLTKAATSTLSESVTFAWDQSYAITAGAGEVAGRVEITQGEAPVTAGSTGSILYADNGGTAGHLALIYDDGNFGPPGTSTNLAVSNDSSLQFRGVVRKTGTIPIIGIIVNAGSTAGQASAPWQNFMPGMQTIANFPSSYLIASPIGDPGTRWWATSAIVGANIVVTISLASAASQNTSFYSIPWPNWM